ncbi:hypothetical protein CORC01_06232, partial [Colletotrichum orchidophilum]
VIILQDRKPKLRGFGHPRCLFQDTDEHQHPPAASSHDPVLDSVTSRDTAFREKGMEYCVSVRQAPKTQFSSDSPPTQDPLGPVPTLEQPPDPSSIQRDVVQDVRITCCTLH